MASVSAADTWRDSGVRPYAGPRAARPDATGPDRSMRMSLPPVPPPPPRRPPGYGTGSSASRSLGAARPPMARPEQRTPPPGVSSLTGHTEAAAPPRSGSSRPAARPAGRTRADAADQGSRLTGTLAVLGVFVITLAGGAIDSFFGVGLGTLTLVTLVAATAVATLLVRRRDLLTVVVAPPLVFVVVALVNLGLAPSASVNLPTLATVLVRGFPTMAVATLVAMVLAIVRWAARR